MSLLIRNAVCQKGVPSHTWCIFPARALVLIYASKNYICILISPPSTYPNSMPVYLVVIMSCHAWCTTWGHYACQLVCVYVYVYVFVLQSNAKLCASVPVHHYLCRMHTHSCFIPYLYHFMCSLLFVYRTIHTERDVTMKRQLVEDLKTRLKFLQEMEKSYRGQVEELEKKVHTVHHRWRHHQGHPVS